MRIRPQIDRSWWTSESVDGQPLREILTARDIASVFVFLNRRGWSQAAIAGAVGLSENRVREVMRGVQRITSYQVLERIADGLNIDRPLLGLGYMPVAEPGTTVERVTDRSRLVGDSRTEFPRTTAPTSARVLSANRSGERRSAGSPGQEDSSAEITEPDPAVGHAAHASADFAMWADQAVVGSVTLDVLRQRLSQLAVDYVTQPLGWVFAELVELRDQLFTTIKSRPDPRCLTDLFALAGTTCAMLAYASGDLGNPHAAMIQTQAALACTEKADSPVLTAWILGNRAMTSEWYGRPREALIHIEQATTQARRARVPGTVLVRLAAIEARAHARRGDAGPARAALCRAVEARAAIGDGYSCERDEFDEIGGILTFSLAKQQFYSGSTYLRIGDLAAAQQSTLAAIGAYTTGPVGQRSYGDETLAWVDLAIARARRSDGQGPDLEGAAEAIAMVRSLSPALRLPALTRPLDELLTELENPRYRHSPASSGLLEAVDELMASCRARPGEITT